jgi:alpha-N-acetylglucosaminidase
MYNSLISSWRTQDFQTFRKQGDALLNFLLDLDKVLSTDETFTLQKWLLDARRWASNPDEEMYLEYSARNQVTIWGPSAQINDYASKQWGGLVRDYYVPRYHHAVVG